MKKICPLLKKACVENRCMLWKPLTFEKPGEDAIIQWDCSLNWNMIMQLENAKQFRYVAASMDKAANEIQAGAGSVLLRAMGAGESRRLK